ncbi:MAG: indolepyruvate oxidoreductase subunit beta [Spirochaetaceae bacterium]|nr:indolepyruvate oxidoreductase subunit beta [Spirochaetaceae bacterium]
MKYDIVLCGVGGQGVLSVAAAIAAAAASEGLHVRQSEVHGMAQRGGAVMSHLRLSDEEIPGDLVPRGEADMILSMEALETLRYTGYLKPDGICVSAAAAFENIPNYPALETVISRVESMPNSRLVDAAALAKDAGNRRAVNMVMVGAASMFLPLPQQTLESAITSLFSRKGEKIVEMNIKAFHSGRDS